MISRTKNNYRILYGALSFLGAFFVLAASARGEITVTSPAVKDTVKAAPDYATEVLHDRWDMNQRTDLGWRIFNTLEQPVSLLSNISFSNGLFTATSDPISDPTISDANISVLDSNYTGSAGLGKFGSNYKIDADKYTVFAVRMYITPPIHSWRTGQLFWSENTIYSGSNWSNTFMIYGGWAIYLIDLPTLGLLGGQTTPPVGWTGLKDSLRFDPTTQPDKTIQIDWIRLVQNGADFRRTIAWTGTGSVDIYLDNDSTAVNGNLGLLAKDVTGGSYPFVAGGLAAGDYYVAIVPAGTTTGYSYSSGYYRVTEQPIVRINKPSDEGSDQDFMTVTAGNPWDFNALTDVDHTVNVHDKSIQTITYEDLAGTTYADNTVFYGVSDATSGIGDPTVFFLNFAIRGKTYKIDTSRYHNLVAKMGIEGVHSTNDGSIARVMYMREDEHTVGENVSQDIIIRHMPLPGGKWVMQKIVADLRTLPLEDGGSSPSHSGWTGTIDTFRIDPHEFSAARAFFYDDIRITSDWRADASFTIEWTFEDADTPSGATMSLYYDSDRSGYNGTLIQSGIPAVSGTGSYVWNTTNVPSGTHYVYAVVDDGLNQNKFYATGPLIIDHTGNPAMSLSQQSLQFGAEHDGAVPPAETVILTNGGTGTLNWTATPSVDWISVTPIGGTGSGALTVGISRTNMSSGYYTGTITVSDPNASNSPQIINVGLDVLWPGTDSPPFGNYATPVDGATVASSVPVTGWALDDIGVMSVKLYRGTGLSDRVYIGDASFVPGARPDVEAFYPSYPQSDRAGWGYMLLTNFLPNDGNGTFQILAYATDTTGHEVLLGGKTITCDNLNAVLPFGAIDTPTQGGTASGSTYVNFGWALTPQPKSIPTDGSTITVWVDGVPLGHPVYNNYRADIATLFPGYANSGGSVGYYYLDTTAYAGGAHTIVWSVTDSAGQTDGIGSRYFTIQNTAGASGLSSRQNAVSRSTDDLSRLPEDRQTPVYVKRGFDDNQPVETVYPQADGSILIEIPEVSLVVVSLTPETAGEMEEDSAARGRRILKMSGSADLGFEAYELVGRELRPLPIGASFDPRAGVFFWQPGPGFLGEYTIVFAKNTDTRMSRKTVTIKIISKTGGPDL